MKQTAVEFLEKQIRYYISNDDRLYDMFTQAKAMEKEQIKEAYIMSLLDGDNKIRRDAEDYYNETFKSKNIEKFKKQ